MPGTSRGSGRQVDTKVAGASSRVSVDEQAQRLWLDEPGDVGTQNAPAFLRNNRKATQKHRTVERRAFIENSRYVGDMRPWHTTDGQNREVVRQVDWGCFAFLSECVYTFEEVSGDILQFRDPETMHDDFFAALCYVAARWQTEYFLALPKSRRMLISWLSRAMNVWYALLHPGQSIYVASTDLEASEKMVYRCKFIIDHIPPECIPKHVMPPIEFLRGTSQSGRHDIINRVIIRHSEHEAGTLDSFIQAVPAKDDLRGEGASEVDLEEFAFWKNGKGIWDGLTGTLIGSQRKDKPRTQGRIVMVSTPNSPSQMSDIVLDRLSSS